MNSILVPTDFSVCSEGAIEYALKLATKFDAEVTLLHAYHIPSAGSSIYIWDLESGMRKKREAKLDKLIDRLSNDYPSVTINKHLTLGYAVNEILTFLESNLVDLVVMGTKGASGLKEVFLGSQTAHLIGSTKTPIMAVPECEDIVLPNLFSLATDLKEINSVLNLKFLKWMVVGLSADLKIITIQDQDKGGEFLGAKDEAIVQLTEMLGEKHVSVEVIPSDNVDEEILRSTEQLENVLVLVHKSRGLLQKIIDPSLSEKLAMRAQTPLLILNDQ